MGGTQQFHPAGRVPPVTSVRGSCPGNHFDEGESILKLKPAGYYVVQHECVYVGGGRLKSDVTLCEPKHRSAIAVIAAKQRVDPIKKKGSKREN